MITLLALLQVAVLPPPSRPPQVAMPPADWTAMPELPLARRVASPPDISQFVRNEVRAGRCAAPRTANGDVSLSIDLAVQIGDQNVIRRVVPRAIQCPTVEQYASGLVLAMTRGNVLAASGWYRTTLTFAWSG